MGSPILRQPLLINYSPLIAVLTQIIYLNKTGGNTLTLECGDEDYGYLLIPNKSEARISVDGLVGGFVLEGSNYMRKYLLCV